MSSYLEHRAGGNATSVGDEGVRGNAMRKISKNQIIWAALVLIILSLTFPPYGYSKIHITEFSTSSRLGDFTNEQNIEKPWTFIGYKFIFSEPPNINPELSDKYSKPYRKDTFSVANATDVNIAWRIVTIQIALIILVAVGLIVTSRNNLKGSQMVDPLTKKKPETALDDLINAVYGNPPPARTAKLEDAIEIAYKELLFEQITKEEVTKVAKELYLSPIPYSTHDLALSVALHFFKQPQRKEQLSEVQLFARTALQPWINEKKVVIPLAQSFEATLYKLYKT